MWDLIKIRELTARKFAKQELAIHKQMAHPNVVLFMAAALTSGHLLLIMEYINGPNLQQMLFDDEFEGPEPTYAVKLNIASQVAQALCYLHDRKPTVIHCDVKPANIMVSPNYDVTKLADLGISKVRQMDQTMTTANRAILPGTPVYLAPEVLLNGAKTGKSTDIWSYGCTSVELFTEKECWSCYADLDEVDGNESDDEDAATAALKLFINKRLPPFGKNLQCGKKGLNKMITKCVSYVP